MLSAQMIDPSRIIETIPAQALTGSVPGTWKVTMRKTFTGFLEARFNGLSTGDTVFIKISDRRDTFDTFHQDYYYVARGEDGETFRNRFNYAAGRYVHLSGLKRPPEWLDFTFQTTREGELFTPYANHPAMFLGDWLGSGPRTEFGDLPEAQFFGNCVHVMSLQLLNDIAGVLGQSDEAASYHRRIAPLKAKIHKTYYNPATGAYANGDQVRTAWALFAGVVPDTLRLAVLAHLKNDMTGAHPYFDIGSSSRYPYFKTLLAHPKIFHQTVAGLLSKTTYPGYGYFLQQDETTRPEAWDASVNAHVHTSYVGISAWLIKGLAGIEQVAAGSRKVVIRPHPVDRLTFARAAVQSPYGEMECGWRRNGGKITYELTVPVGVQAEVYLPDASRESGYSFREVAAGKYKWDIQNYN
jgi:hypothetical protein